MTFVRRRPGAGLIRPSRIDARLWILGAVLSMLAVGLWVGYAAALPVFTQPSLPWWAFAIAFFGAARLATMDSPRRGTQAITLAAAPFVVGLFHARPLDLLVGYVVGTAVAAATRRPRAVWQTAYDIIRFAVFAVIGIWAFRAISGSPNLPVWHRQLGALAARAGREPEPSILLLLNRARAIFHAEIAQLTVFPSQPAEKAFRTTVRHGRPDEVMIPLGLGELDDVLEAETAGVIVRAGNADDPSSQMLAHRGVGEAMVALLRGESRMIGSLMVGGHLDARSFDMRDLRLFRTLATRTTAILENSRMERSIARLTELQEQLTHQAYHDSLTDLANRSLFGQQIDHALRRSAEGTASVAVIFLDIDDFKGVNDTLGHAAGDALLVEVASRIRGCLRRPDTAARLGGDEFALLIEGVDSAIEAEHVARRVLDVLREPFTGSGTSVIVRASLGIA